MAAVAFEAESDLPSTDEELIRQTLAGDGAAYGVIVERYQRKIYRIAQSILRDEMEADIVTQDVFVQAYSSLGKFERKSGLATWLTRIAINRARDVIRRKRVRSFFSIGTPESEGGSPELRDEQPDAERLAISTQLLTSIDRAVAGLSEQQRIIFSLRHYEDLSLEEIAANLNLRPGTVRTHLFRAIHKLRKELSAWVSAEVTPEESIS
jgi:RNA polymerase sigma-70 factor (ECF subfamily)